MANDTNALPLVYQCVSCDWRWRADHPYAYNTDFDEGTMFVGKGACPACAGPNAIDLRKAG
jgi:hypothetical protein